MMAPETNVQTSQNSNTSVGVTVTTKTESTRIGEGLELNPSYFKTVPGILKIIQLVLAVICMICASPAYVGFVHFFLFVVVTFFIITFLLCIIHFFSVQNMLPTVPWLVAELIATAVALGLYLLASIIQLAMTARADYRYAFTHYTGTYGAYIAAGVMGLLNSIAYGAGAFFLYTEFRGSSHSTASPATNGNA